MNLIEKTKEYIDAFDQKNIDKVQDMFCDNAALFDPANANGLFGRSSIIKMIDNLFKQTKKLSFKAINIFSDKDTSIIEFSLQIEKKTLHGVDIIVWEGAKIKELRAYLYQK